MTSRAVCELGEMPNVATPLQLVTNLIPTITPPHTSGSPTFLKQCFVSAALLPPLVSLVEVTLVQSILFSETKASSRPDNGHRSGHVKPRKTQRAL